jgi:predicted DNA-binding transcriptional regulator AlpA
MDDIILISLKRGDIADLIEKSVQSALNTYSQKTEDNQYITIKQGCSILSVTPTTIYDYIRKGKLTLFKIESTSRLLKSEVCSLAKAQ